MDKLEIILKAGGIPKSFWLVEGGNTFTQCVLPKSENESNEFLVAATPTLNRGVQEGPLTVSEMIMPHQNKIGKLMDRR